MRIALFGYGKMGKVIETIAKKRGHTIDLKVNSQSQDYALKDIDVAIDFSLPKVAVNHIKTCLNNYIPIVSGTTGWLSQYDEMVQLCKKQYGTFLYASNFSLGVNIFFELNTKLAELMKDLSEYKVNIEETHHTQKLDKPSGTAITLAEGIISNSKYQSWSLENPKSDELGIISKRIENVPGTHEVIYESSVDTLKLEHIAHNREGFALGAVIAAEYVVDKKGIFTMKDVLNIR